MLPRLKLFATTGTLAVLIGALGATATPALADVRFEIRSPFFGYSEAPEFIEVEPGVQVVTNACTATITVRGSM